jgi:mono/diheme cytochrome c family protein
MPKLSAIVALFVISGTVALGASASYPAAANPPAQTAAVSSGDAKAHAGEMLFQQKCVQCHAVLEGQYSFGPNLHAEMKKPHPKKSAAEVRVIIKDGKGKMPAFADKLTQPDTDNLIAYMRTL